MKPAWLHIIIGVLAGVLIMAGLRWFTYVPPVHHHANFAIYVNGQRETFEGPGYYEEVASCSMDQELPEQRAHLHDNVNDVVHVHDQAVTWGNFFENLGFSVANGFLQTNRGLYVSSPDSSLYFILNGQQVEDIASRVITSEDKLLITYGSPLAEATAQYELVDSTAHLYNERLDPTACSGQSGWLTRLKQSFIN